MTSSPADVNVDGKRVGAVASDPLPNVSANHTSEVAFPVSGGHVNWQTGVVFEDIVAKDWFCEGVDQAVANGWFAGTSDKTLFPHISTTHGLICITA